MIKKIGFRARIRNLAKEKKGIRKFNVILGAFISLGLMSITFEAKAEIIGSPIYVIPFLKGEIIVNSSTNDGCNLTDAIIASNNGSSYKNCIYTGILNSADENIISISDGLDFSYTKAYASTSNALPAITQSVSIRGGTSGFTGNIHGTVIRRYGQEANFRLFEVSNGAKATFSNISIRAGLADRGGAIFVNQATVRLDDVVLSPNKATIGGGAIHVTEGWLYINNSSISGNAATNFGGAISSNTAYIEITDSILSNNVSGSNGGAMHGYDTNLKIVGSEINNNTAGYTGGGGGGGINMRKVSISNFVINIEIEDSLFKNNNAAGSGGGILVEAHYSGTFLANKLILEGNNAGNAGLGGRGGGIHLSHMNSAKINESIIKSNRAIGWIGGGIDVTDSKLDIDTSTITENTAINSAGAGISVNNYDDVNYNTTTISNSTLSLNKADYGGGGIFIANGNVRFTNSTLSNNSLTPNDYSDGNTTIEAANSRLSMSHSTIVTNSPNLDEFIVELRGVSNLSMVHSVITTTGDQPICSISQNSQEPYFQNNWFSDDSCNGVANGDPKLSRLRNNGGPTLTHAPRPNSPLAGAANGVYCRAPDQRGVPRDENACFIGAVEGFLDISYIVPIISSWLLDEE